MVPEAWPADAAEEPDDFELGGEPAPVGGPNGCNPFVTAVERRGGDLLVRAIEVILYPGDKIRRYRLADWTSAAPKLIESRPR